MIGFPQGGRKMYNIVIFGKKGCAKCKILKKRIAKVLEDEKYSAYLCTEKDITLDNDLVDLCNAECINPQQIPAFYVETEGKPIVRTSHFSQIELSCLYGVYTNYSTTGTILEEDIRNILDQVLALKLGNEKMKKDP